MTSMARALCTAALVPVTHCCWPCILPGTHHHLRDVVHEAIGAGLGTRAVTSALPAGQGAKMGFLRAETEVALLPAWRDLYEAQQEHCQ